MGVQRRRQKVLLLLLVVCICSLWSGSIGSATASSTEMDEVLDFDAEETTTGKQQQQLADVDSVVAKEDDEVAVDLQDTESEDKKVQTDEEASLDGSVSQETRESEGETTAEVVDSTPPSSSDGSSTSDQNEASYAATTDEQPSSIAEAMIESDATAEQQTSSHRPNLDELSNEQLEAICTDRGFLIDKSDGTEITREEFIEAAQSCLAMEEEMNTIMDENPELAVELEAEIERMKAEKERLEAERDTMLEQKAGLEEKLLDSDVDPAEIGSTHQSSLSGDAQSDTVDGVLRKSFELLFERVGRDMRLVGKVLRIAFFRPAWSGISFGWKYVGPSVEELIKKSLVVGDGIVLPAQLESIRKTIASQAMPISRFVRQRLLPPLLSKTNGVLRLAAERLNKNEKVHQVSVVVGAFFGPLKNSLQEGWTSIRPDLVAAKRATISWLIRLRNEKRSLVAS